MATGKQIQRALRKARRDAKAATALGQYNDAVEKYEAATKPGRGGKPSGDPGAIADAKVNILEAIRNYRIATKGKGSPRGRMPPGSEKWLQ